ncbi:MAG: hypothetical protein Q9M92_08815 [Enterobacterales bacterium]|nr:hypothetical protein [Enterobacterales bacterium]
MLTIEDENNEYKKKYLCMVLLGAFVSLSAAAASPAKTKVGASAPKANKAMGKRKCIRNGGTFYEYADGRKICVPARNSTARKPSPSDTLKMSDKKKCWKAGGVWITKPEPMGTFCMKKLSAMR